jgi:hypothetical protein
MPYELTFNKRVDVSITKDYINDCCYGGDVVADQLLPALKGRCQGCQGADQEDWGWFIWFRDGEAFLAVDIYCDDLAAGVFKVHLTSRKNRWLRPSNIADSPALEELKEIVVVRLTEWVGTAPSVELLDAKYLPKST